MPSQFRLLGSPEKAWIAAFICQLIPTAMDEHHPMARVATQQISLSMWRWTADGINKDGQVVPDSIKYDTDLLSATAGAKEASAQGLRRMLRHEHVIPRALLTQRIINSGADVAGISAIMEKYCKAVIVTVEEDRRLSRSSMPVGWSWETGEVLGRYIAAGLHNSVRHPEVRRVTR